MVVIMKSLLQTDVNTSTQACFYHNYRIFETAIFLRSLILNVTTTFGIDDVAQSGWNTIIYGEFYKGSAP